jgi:hypothetical protein
VHLGVQWEKNDVFVVKLFVRTYLIAKVDVVVALIPMENVLFCVKRNDMVIHIYLHILGGKIGTLLNQVFINKRKGNYVNAFSFIEINC